MKVIVTGGTGFIGKRLVESLTGDAHKVVVLTRRPEHFRDSHTAVHYEGWDARRPGPWMAHFEGADAIMNLAGEPIAARRWTVEQKRRIVLSRVQTTEAIVSAIKQAENGPKILVSVSAVGYYGSVPTERKVEEDAPPGKGFLAETAEKWERAARQAEAAGVRVAIPRVGIVLGEGGGALEKMIPPFRYFIGGPLGSGKQWLPWIHRDDVIGVLRFTLRNPDVSGAFNASAPHPVVMKDFCKILAKLIKRPSWAPVPAFALKLLLGEMAEMLLTGQRAVPEKLQAWGYRFQYEDLEAALRAVVGREDV